MFLLTLACTWVSQESYDDRLKQLDDDGDGFTLDGGGDPALVDCNDDDAAINPGAEEVWYDGVDSDCAGDDDYDKDLDGYQHESSPDATAVDCNDQDPEIFPGADDSWYDNIDSNCDGADDFDQDGDGVQARPPEGPGNDCNDLDPDFRYDPNDPPVDSWYDGMDHDCEGNNDLDQDGDGYVATEYLDVDTYWDADLTIDCSDCLTGRDFDCDDEEATTYQGATDAWYDGVDSDCAGDNDYDQDLDGFSDPSDPDATITDCDDEDIEASPDGLEDVTDPRDLDCDGSYNSVKAPDQGLVFVSPHDLRAGEDSNRTYFSVAGREITLASSGTTYYDTAVGFWYSFTDPTAGIQGEDIWLTKLTSNPAGLDLSSGHDVVIDDGYIYGATGLLTSSGRRVDISRYDISATTTQQAVKLESGPTVDFNDIALGIEDGVYHAFACADTDIQYVQANDATILAEAIEGSAYYTAGGATSCSVHFFDGADLGILGVTETSTGDYVTYSFDPEESAPTLTEETRGSDVSPADLDYPWFTNQLTVVLVDDVNSLVIVRQGGSEAQIVTPGPPLNAALAVHPTDGTLYVAWADVGGTAGFAYGDVTSGFTKARITTSFVAYEAVPWVTATGNHLMLGVLGSSEVGVAVLSAP